MVLFRCMSSISDPRHGMQWPLYAVSRMLCSGIRIWLVSKHLFVQCKWRVFPPAPESTLMCRLPPTRGLACLTIRVHGVCFVSHFISGDVTDQDWTEWPGVFFTIFSIDLHFVLRFLLVGCCSWRSPVSTLALLRRALFFGLSLLLSSFSAELFPAALIIICTPRIRNSMPAFHWWMKAQAPGGTKGFSLKPKAVMRYCLTSAYRSAYIWDSY